MYCGGHSWVTPSISSPSLRPCQGARGGTGVSYHSQCPGCDPARGRGTWQEGPRSSSPRRRCAGGGPGGCSSRTCPARSHRMLGGAGDCGAPSAARWEMGQPPAPPQLPAELRAGAGCLTAVAGPQWLGQAVPIPTSACPPWPVPGVPAAGALTWLGAGSVRDVQVVQRDVAVVPPSSHRLEYRLPERGAGGHHRPVPLPTTRAPATLPCLTCQSSSARTVTWPRCQASPSMALTLSTFLCTPLSSTKTPREPAQGSRHAESVRGRAVRDPHPSGGAPGDSGGVAALTWGPGAQLVPEGQALGGRGGLVGLGGEGSHGPRRQGPPARAHHHVMAWGERSPHTVTPARPCRGHQGTAGLGSTPSLGIPPAPGLGGPGAGELRV